MNFDYEPIVIKELAKDTVYWVLIDYEIHELIIGDEIGCSHFNHLGPVEEIYGEQEFNRLKSPEEIPYGVIRIIAKELEK